MPLPKSLVIAAPSLRENFTGYFVKSVFDLQKLCIPAGITVNLSIAGRISLVCHARNLLASKFLYETSASHMLFVDDDIGFDAHHIYQMLEWSHLPVVGALYPGKKIDWDHVRDIALSNPDISGRELERAAALYRQQFSTAGYNVDPSVIGGERPFEVSFVATGLMLISREILVKLIAHGLAPLKESNVEEARDLQIHHFFQTTYSGDRSTVGEDVSFCRAVRSIGEPVHACGWPHVVHTGLHDHFGSLPVAISRGVIPRE